MTDSMTTEMRTALKRLLIKHEGLELNPYVDTKNNITIGIGRNLSGKGISQDEADLMFDNDINYIFNFLSSYDWFHGLNEARQIALIDFCFAGTKTFQKFTQMIKYLQASDFNNAANEIINSDYAKQVGNRAKDIANILKTGAF